MQTYSLDLEISDKFFLWLFEGNSDAQETSPENQQTSGFFFISNTSTTTTSSSSSSPVIPSSSTESTVPSTTAGTSTTSDVSYSNPSAADGELSAGAKAGIGVGGGIAGLAILSALFLLVKYRSKKKKLEELRSRNYLSPPGSPSVKHRYNMTVSSTTAIQQSPSNMLENNNRTMAELE